MCADASNGISDTIMLDRRRDIRGGYRVFAISVIEIIATFTIKAIVYIIRYLRRLFLGIEVVIKIANMNVKGEKAHTT